MGRVRKSRQKEAARVCSGRGFMGIECGGTWEAVEVCLRTPDGPKFLRASIPDAFSFCRLKKNFLLLLLVSRKPTSDEQHGDRRRHS